jgi:hypothetical protein
MGSRLRCVTPAVGAGSGSDQGMQLRGADQAQLPLLAAEGRQVFVQAGQPVLCRCGADTIMSDPLARRREG